MMLIGIVKHRVLQATAPLLPRLRSYKMGELVSLEEVDASVLPAKVLVLLSKYAQAIRKHTGLVIKISSLNIFKHVHNTNIMTDHQQVEQLYRELLLEVNSHLRGGTMRTHLQQKLSDPKVRQHIGLRRRGENGELLVSRNSSRLNSNNLEIESSFSFSV